MKSILAFTLLIDVLNGLSGSSSPGGNFDLNYWKLTLPDSSASEKSDDQLEGGYSGTYFYTDSSDGSMVFYVKSSGGTTDGSSYPRSELRQLCKPDGVSNPDRYNWKITGTNRVNGQYKIGTSTTGSKVVIQQIHAYDAPPLVKILWETSSGGRIRALVKTDASGNNEQSYTMATGIPTGTKFWVKTTVKDGYLKLYYNGVKKVDHKINYWSNYGNYFKAGNYLQENSGNTKSYVHIYSLELYSSSSSNCYYTSDTLIFGDDDDSSSISGIEIAEIIAIVLVSILVIALCVFIGYYVYNKKYKKNYGFKVDDNDEKQQKKEEKEEEGNTVNTPDTQTEETLNPDPESQEEETVEVEVDIQV